jgi:hypothetical protein
MVDDYHQDNTGFGEVSPPYSPLQNLDSSELPGLVHEELSVVVSNAFTAGPVTTDAGFVDLDTVSLATQENEDIMSDASSIESKESDAESLLISDDEDSVESILADELLSAV